MLLRQRGELNLLREIRRRFGSTPTAPDSGIILGIGDDAAVIDPGKGRILVTTDMMNEGVHFDLRFTASFHLGFKLVSVNVSDIMAMGGRPRYLFLNVAMKRETDEQFFWDFFEGVRSAAERYCAHVLGGDLSAAEHDMVVSATVIGTGEKVLTRAGASVGDKIYVTGTLGDAAGGLEVLKVLSAESARVIRNERFDERGGRFDEDDTMLSLTTPPFRLKWAKARPLVRRHLMPVARQPVPYLAYATSMIDVSDGLFIDLCRVCEESGVGAKAYLDRVPVSPELRYVSEVLGLDPLALAVSGGEDYELLFTAPDLPPETAKVSDVTVTCVGEIVERELTVVDETGRESPLKPAGYEHFGAAG